jgi:Tol biopolymer transport system component
MVSVSRYEGQRELDALQWYNPRCLTPMIRAAILLPILTSALLFACGDDDGPSYSSEPAGHILFTTDREGNEEIFIMAADGSDPVNLTNDPANDSEAKFNATGDAVAFVSFRGEQPDIWTMSADGSDLTQITDDAASDSRPLWSPDGTKIAHFSSKDERMGHLWLTDIETGGDGPLLGFLPNEAGTECYGGTPTDWPSPGDLIYQGIQANISSGQICTLDPDELQTRLILGKEDVVMIEGVLSPDGKKLAFTSDEIGNLDIWVADGDGSNAVRLTFDPGVDAGPAWSPDGQWIAFSSQRDGDNEIYIMRPDGTDVRKLTDNDAEDTIPDWTD